MEYLYKFYRKHDRDKYKNELENRSNSPNKVDVNFNIKEYNHKKVSQLYFIPTLKMLNLVEKVSYRDIVIKGLFNDLPTVAQSAFKRELIIDELQSTNEIEGVSSTKAEIANSLRALEEKDKSNFRFKSMISSYLNVFDKEVELPRNPKELRVIYDELVSDEVHAENKLDGQLFRNENVQVVTSTQKVIHQGAIGHNEIVKNLENMLSILNDKSEIPQIIRIAVGHYIFGYIHPFYDGNGRVSRYLNSLYLSDSHSGLTAVSLAKSINQHKKKYYEIFKHTNAEISNGELNEFIENFIEFIADGQTYIKEELIMKYKLIDEAYEKIEREEKLRNKNERFFSALFILAQNDLFTNNASMQAKDIASYLSVSVVTARHTLNELIEMELAESAGENPKFYKPKKGYFNKFINK